MTIKNMNIYLIVAMATVFTGLSAVESTTYKTFLWKVLKTITMPVSIETKAIDNTGAVSMPKMPDFSACCGIIKPEMRMIGKESDPKVVVVGRPHNGF